MPSTFLSEHYIWLVIDYQQFNLYYFKTTTSIEITTEEPNTLHNTCPSSKIGLLKPKQKPRNLRKLPCFLVR